MAFDRCLIKDYLLTYLLPTISKQQATMCYCYAYLVAFVFVTATRESRKDRATELKLPGTSYAYTAWQGAGK